MKTKLGVKGSIADTQINDRLQYNPEIYEIHLNEEDLFGSRRNLLEDKIKFLQSKGIKVYLHQPMNILGKYLHINKKDCIEEDYLNLSTKILVHLCKKYNLKCVIHINYSPLNENYEPLVPTKESYEYTLDNLLKFIAKMDSNKEYLVFENSTIGVGSYRKDFYLAELLKRHNIPLCMDISHLAIGFDTTNSELNDYIVRTLDILIDNIEYFHVVDSKAVGIHDGLKLGTGVVDWKRIKHFICQKDYIYEIDLKDITDAADMIESHVYFTNI